jgi:hypothetical protein
MTSKWSRKSLRRMIYFLGGTAILVVSLCLPRSAEAVCVETDHGNGWSYVDCGTCGAVWRGGTMVNFGCGDQKPIDPYQNLEMN